MERNNETSLNRQRQRQQRNEYSENLIDPVTRQNVGDRIDQFKNYRSSGDINNTKVAKQVEGEIERLELVKQQAEEQFKQAQEEDRQRGGAGQDASTDTGNGMPTFEERERAAGLSLDSNDPMSGRRLSNPTMDEREAAAGLFNTTLGRNFTEEQRQPSEVVDMPSEEEDQMATFGVIIAINGEPYSASIYGQIGGKLVS